MKEKKENNIDMSVMYNMPYRLPKPLVFEDTPSAFVPDQSMPIEDMIARFQRGQRLLVNQRPVNVYSDEDFDAGKVHDEDFNDVQPQLDDESELYAYQEELKERKRNLKERIEEKRKKVEEERKKKQDPKPAEPSGDSNK